MNIGRNIRMNQLIALLLLGAALAACTPPPEEPKKVEAEGREETRSIRNTKEIGYSGDAIADRLDKALDASEAQAQQMKEAQEAAGQ
jgi:hypothetical protein